ncbi:MULTISPECIES: AAA family ATPase [Vibrio]|uniref:nucleotide-binding protein n=1 Tax=Vibrio TaxID=662 RepID=UPI0005170619|nr:AAA family ATPase [Vibrio cyclitrophicus]
MPLQLRKNTISLANTKAKKVLIMNSKGGVGKSTVVIGIISQLLNQGYKVALIDFDKQKSSHDWAINIIPGFVSAYTPSFYSLSELTLKIRVPKDTDFVIVDSPSNFTQGEMARYIHFMDGVIIPMAPSPIDLHASLPFIKSLLDSKVLSRKKISLSFIINRCYSHDERLRKVHHLLSHFRHYPTIGVVTEDRCYQDAFYNRTVLTGTHDKNTWDKIVNWIQRLPGK